MKTTTNKLGLCFIAAALFFSSCGGEEKKSFLSKESQEALKDKPEVVEYLESLDEAVGAYVSMMEDVAQNSKDASEDGEVTSGEALGAVGSMMGGVLGMSEALEKLDKLEEDKVALEENLSPEEKKAFVETYTHIIERMMKFKKPE